MKKKGFTLLELLAVIIILAVIALIATPIVLNVVDEAKKSAFQDSSYGLIKSGEYYYTSQILNGGMTSDKVFNFPNNTELEFSGTEPESGYIKVTKEGLVEIAVSDGKYCATKGLNEEKVTIKEYVEGECVIGDNELTQLQAPTISINDNVLNIISNDENTKEYEIYVDGELKTTIAAVDLAMTVPAFASEQDYVGFTPNISSSNLLNVTAFESVVGVYDAQWQAGEKFGDSIEFVKEYNETQYAKFYTYEVRFLNGGEWVAEWQFFATTREPSIGIASVVITAPADELITAMAVVADEENVIKAGTYRFNDVLTAPSEELYAELTSTSGNLNILEITAESADGVVALSYYADKVIGGNNVLEQNIVYISMAFGDYIEGWQSIDFQTITISNDSEVSAEFYEWFTANAEQIGVSYDLSSLNLENGIYDITVKSIADGYESSEFSNSVEYTVGNILSGTWELNEVLAKPNISSDNQLHELVNYNLPDSTSYNGHTFLGFMLSDFGLRYGYSPGGYWVGYSFEESTIGWQHTDWRTVDFGETELEVSPEFYEWFTANATKQ